MTTGQNNPPTIQPVGTLTAPTVQPYQSYLPSAFDDSLSMLEKINLLIAQFQAVIDNNNSISEQWQVITDWVLGDGEKSAVAAQLTTWMNDGTLNNIINQEVFGSIQNRLSYLESEGVSPIKYGAVGDGQTDDTQIFLNMIADDVPIILPKGITFKVTPFNIDKPVLIGGQGTFKLDGSITLKDSACSQSIIKDISFEPISVPDLITRWNSSGDWLANYTYSDNSSYGYQATSNDKDFTGSQTSVGCGIESINNDELLLQNIRGNQVHLYVNGGNRNIITDNNIIGGKGNAYGSIIVAFGKSNIITKNQVKYSSFSGITLIGQNSSMAVNNVSIYNGESGIKTYQNTLNSKDARNYDCVISNNVSHHNYYDGFDVSMDNPHTGTIEANNTIVGNKSHHNRKTGYWGDGKSFLFMNNKSHDNGSSNIYLNFNESTINSNQSKNGNLAANSGYNNVTVDGQNNVIIGNKSYQDNKNGYNFYITNTGNLFAFNDGRDSTGVQQIDIVSPSSNIIMSNYDNVQSENEIKGLPVTIYSFLKALDGITSVMGENTSENVLTLENDNASANDVSMDFYVRSTLLTNSVAKFIGKLTNGVNNSESGKMTIQTINQGNWNDSLIVNPDGSIIALLGANGGSFATSARPTPNSGIGTMIFDSTLNKPIWYSGSGNWVDATGASV